MSKEQRAKNNEQRTMSKEQGTMSNEETGQKIVDATGFAYKRIVAFVDAYDKYLFKDISDYLPVYICKDIEDFEGAVAADTLNVYSTRALRKEETFERIKAIVENNGGVIFREFRLRQFEGGDEPEIFNPNVVQGKYDIKNVIHEFQGWVRLGEREDLKELGFVRHLTLIYDKPIRIFAAYEGGGGFKKWEEEQGTMNR